MDLWAVAIGLIALVGGLVLGFFLAQSIASAALRTSEAREADLDTQLAGTRRDLQLAEDSRSREEAAVSALRDSLAAATEGRVRAETQMARVSGLEQDIGSRDERIAQLTAVISDLRVSLAKSEETLRSEQQLGVDKLGLLREAETQLREAFKSVASDSLRANSETFFQMARDKLDSVRRESAEDLESKKREIDQIVEPVRKTLESLDQQSRSLEKEREAKLAGLQEQLRELSDTNRRLLIKSTPHETELGSGALWND